MKGSLGFVFIRTKLFNGVYNERVKESFHETYQEVKKLDTNFGKFMLEMMDSAKIELEKNNLEIAAYDINILHNLPSNSHAHWNEEYFYNGEILGYIDVMSERKRPDKIKKIIELVADLLI